MANKKFLDYAGTSYLWNAIKQELNTKATQSALEILAGRVTTLENVKPSEPYDDTEIKAQIQSCEDDISGLDSDITTLIGNDTDKSVRTIANEELTAQLVPSSAKDSLDTLQEIAAWIQSHPDDASAMNSAIANLNTILAGIGDVSNGQKATVKAYVDDAITALSIGDYVTATDLATELSGYMTTSHPANSITSSDLVNYADAVTKKHTHDNMAVLNGITAADVAAWNAALEDTYQAITNAEIDTIIGNNQNENFVQTESGNPLETESGEPIEYDNQGGE